VYVVARHFLHVSRNSRSRSPALRQRTSRTYICNRHDGGIASATAMHPDYKGWRCLHTNGIHMLLRLVQGQWPPASKAVTPVEISAKRDLRRVRPSGWPASAASLRERCLIAVPRHGVFSIGSGSRATERSLRPHPFSMWTLYEVSGRLAKAGVRSKMWPPKYAASLRWLHMTEQPPAIFHPP
jgi:hypothetical protein